MTQYVGEEWSRTRRLPHIPDPASTTSQPGRPAEVLPYRAQSGRSVVQAARARSIPTLTAAVRPTAPVAAACTAWGAAAVGDVRAGEPAR